MNHDEIGKYFANVEPFVNKLSGVIQVRDMADLYVDLRRRGREGE